MLSVEATSKLYALVSQYEQSIESLTIPQELDQVWQARQAGTHRLCICLMGAMPPYPRDRRPMGVGYAASH